MGNMKRLLGFALLASSGCFAGGEAAYPLYSPPDPALPRAEVATLAGPIESVDGVRVAGVAASFALKPGCHEVTNQQHWGGSDGMSATIAHLPELTYNVQMRAGYSYALEISATSSHLTMRMAERNPDGVVTDTIQAGAICAAPGVTAN